MMKPTTAGQSLTDKQLSRPVQQAAPAGPRQGRAAQQTDPERLDLARVRRHVPLTRRADAVNCRASLPESGRNASGGWGVKLQPFRMLWSQVFEGSPNNAAIECFTFWIRNVAKAAGAFSPLSNASKNSKTLPVGQVFRQSCGYSHH